MSSGREVDLAIEEQYWGRSLAAMTWKWPAAVRCAIRLVDVLADQAEGSEESPVVFLPARVRISEEGKGHLDPAEIEDAGPYVAPEVLAGDGATERSTIYGIGALLFHMLTGRPPLGDVWRLDEVAPEIPLRLKEVVLCALEVDPDKRYESMAAFRLALVGVIVPLAWWEQLLPRLPLPEEQAEKIAETGYRLRDRWVQIRDRLPWQQFGRVMRRGRQLLDREAARQAITLIGLTLFVVFLLALF